MLEILSFAVEEDMVVSIHPTDPDDMEKLAAALPRMKPVAAHFGGYGQYEGHPGLYAETSERVFRLFRARIRL